MTIDICTTFGISKKELDNIYASYNLAELNKKKRWVAKMRKLNEFGLIHNDEPWRWELFKKYAHTRHDIIQDEAIHIFREEIAVMAIDHINNDTEKDKWQSILDRFNNKSRLEFSEKVRRAKEVDIEGLVSRFGHEVRQNKVKCPFHDDGSASLHLYYDSNTWWCFGCQSGSSTVDFVIMKMSVDFIGAVNFLV